MPPVPEEHEQPDGTVVIKPVHQTQPFPEIARYVRKYYRIFEDQKTRNRTQLNSTPDNQIAASGLGASAAQAGARGAVTDLSRGGVAEHA